MLYYKQRQDDRLIAETYALLIETPATESNVKKFIDKYYTANLQQDYEEAVARYEEEAALDPRGRLALDQVRQEIYDEIYNRYKELAAADLKAWTPRLQQIITASGGKPDIFGYPNIQAVYDAIRSAQTSKTNTKKAYKRAGDANVIFENKKLLVVQPRTWEESRKYFGVRRTSLLTGTEGIEGSHWCTAASNKKHFKEYVQDHGNRLLYIVTKPGDQLYAIRCLGSQHLEGTPEGSAAEFRSQFFAWLKQDFSFDVDFDFSEEDVDAEDFNETFYDCLHDYEDYLTHGNTPDVEDSNIQAIIEIRDQSNEPMFLRDFVEETLGTVSNIHVARYVIDFLCFLIYGTPPPKV